MTFWLSSVYLKAVLAAFATPIWLRATATPTDAPTPAPEPPRPKPTATETLATLALIEPVLDAPTTTPPALFTTLPTI